MLQIKSLSLDFPESGKVFENISFNIKKNKITLLKGNSGCGKSSLLMCISRVIPETIEGKIKGEIIYKDKNIEKEDAVFVSGDIAYMFQDPDSQLCTFTVEDEIAFGLENLNIGSEKMEDIIDETLRFLKIEHLKYRKLNHLSGGEKQKVALASLIVLDPEIILMDEPTANLDIKATKEIIDIIKHMKNDLGKTILIVEHKYKEFIDIVDEVLEFEKDKVTKISKEDLREEIKKDLIPRCGFIKNIEEDVLGINNISFAYENNRKVLDDISFTLKKSEILTILGLNGAGKSTLSKVLMGLIKPSSGEIVLDKENLSLKSPKEIGDKVGLVFQNPEHQFIKLTVEKELALSLNVKGKESSYINSKVEDYLKEFDLLGVRLNNPFSLSQGQKRRLSTASMMINGQPILILDEPTYGQDRENLKKLINLLYNINSEGVSILIITHDIEMALKCSDRAVFLENGKVKYEGIPKYVIEKAFQMKVDEYE